MSATGLSTEQDFALKTFRRELESSGILYDGDSIGSDDDTLLRFLRARQFRIPEAKKMFQDCQTWRQTVEGVGIDELYQQIDPWDFPERRAVFDCWPNWFHKTDKKGRPVNFHAFGNMNLPKLYKECTPERHWQSIIVSAESLPREVAPAASKAANKPISTIVIIVDLKGFGLSQFWQMQTLARSSLQISQDYYPEMLGQLVVVNAPSSFTMIWSVIKPWLAKETLAKVDILGANYKERLLDLIDADSLPSFLGGSCTCDDFGGCSYSSAGPWKVGRKPRAGVPQHQPPGSPNSSL